MIIVVQMDFGACCSPPFQVFFRFEATPNTRIPGTKLNFFNSASKFKPSQTIGSAHHCESYNSLSHPIQNHAGDDSIRKKDD